MMTHVARSLCLFAVALTAADASAEHHPTLVVEARLTGATATPSHPCGEMGWSIVMRYKVLRVLRGRHDPPVLFAINTCGAWYGATGVHIGDVHRLELEPRPVAGWEPLADAFPKEPGPRMLIDSLTQTVVAGGER